MKVYAHFMPERDRAAAEQLDAIIDGSTGAG
jgi:hypothetical protein